MLRSALGTLVLALSLPLVAQAQFPKTPGGPFNPFDPTPRPVQLGQDLIVGAITDPTLGAADPITGFVCNDLNQAAASAGAGGPFFDPTPPLEAGQVPGDQTGAFVPDIGFPYGVNIPLGGATDSPACRIAHNVNGFNFPPVIVGLANPADLVRGYNFAGGEALPPGLGFVPNQGTVVATPGSISDILLDNFQIQGFFDGTNITVPKEMVQAVVTTHFSGAWNAIPDDHPLNANAWSDLVISFDFLSQPGVAHAQFSLKGTACLGALVPEFDPANPSFGQDACIGGTGVHPFWIVGRTQDDGNGWSFFDAFGAPFGPTDVVAGDMGGAHYGDFFAALQTSQFCSTDTAGNLVESFNPAAVEPCNIRNTEGVPLDLANLLINPLVSSAVGFNLPQAVIHATPISLQSGIGVVHDQGLVAMNFGDWALYEVIPEPNSVLLLGAALAGLAAMRRFQS